MNMKNASQHSCDGWRCIQRLFPLGRFDALFPAAASLAVLRLRSLLLTSARGPRQREIGHFLARDLHHGFAQSIARYLREASVVVVSDKMCVDSPLYTEEYVKYSDSK